MFPHRVFSLRYLWCLMFASIDNSINDLWIADNTRAFYSKSEDLGGSHPMLPAVKPSFDRWIFVGSRQPRNTIINKIIPTVFLQLANFTLSLQFSMFVLGVTSPDLTTLTRSSRGELQVRAGDGANRGYFNGAMAAEHQGILYRLCKERC